MRLQQWKWICAGWLLVALAWTPASTLVNDQAPSTADFSRGLLFNILHFSGWAAATPLLFQLCKQLPLQGRVTVRNGALLLLAGLIVIPVITLLLPLSEAVFAVVSGDVLAAAIDPSRLAQRVLITSLFAVPTYFAVIAIGQTLVWARRAQLHAQEAAGAELRALRAELNPHFLFNTLGAIAQLAHRSPDKAETAIASLADVLRTSLADVGSTQTIADAVGEVEEHLALYRVLHGPIRFERRIDDDLWATHLPSRVLVPLVENAMTHGAFDKDGSRWLRLTAQRCGTDRLVMELANPVAASPMPSKGLGSGLEASRRLLAIHSGGQGTLEHCRAGDTYLVRLALPA